MFSAFTLIIAAPSLGSFAHQSTAGSRISQVHRAGPFQRAALKKILTRKEPRCFSTQVRAAPRMKLLIETESRNKAQQNRTAKKERETEHCVLSTCFRLYEFRDASHGQSA